MRQQNDQGHVAGSASFPPRAPGAIQGAMLFPGPTSDTVDKALGYLRFGYISDHPKRIRLGADQRVSSGSTPERVAFRLVGWATRIGLYCSVGMIDESDSSHY
jgi:hypothetical protein